MGHVGHAHVPAAIAGGEQREPAVGDLRFVDRDVAEAADVDPVIDLRIGPSARSNKAIKYKGRITRNSRE